MKAAMFSLVLVFLLIMSLAGGCVPTVIAEDMRSPEQASPAVAGLDDPQELERFLDTLIAGRMEKYHIPSEAVAVVRDGQVVFLKGYGYADLERQIPADPERTLFRIGSVSKLFVWTAVMQLVEQGKLDLHADVNTYLLAAGGRPPVRIPDTYTEPITLAHLLTHTSGFEKQDSYGIFPNGDDWTPLEEYLVAHMPERVDPPGRFLVYSNYGTSLAAYIVEQVSGMPFEEYIERFIYEPLGMTRSTFRQPLPPALSDDLATGVIWWSMKGRGMPAEFEWMQPAGSMSTTAADMARFMIAHLQNGRWGAGENSHRILAEETVLDMHSQHFTYDPQLPGFAYGFFEDLIGDARVIYHAGGSAAFSAHLALVPEHKLGLFEVYSGGRAGSGFIYTQFVEHFFPVSAMPDPSPSSSSPSTRFAGEYVDLAVNHSTPEKLLALTKGIRVQETEGGALSFLGSTWVPVAPLTFQEVNGGDLAVFRTEDGTPEGRATYLLHDELAYERLPWYRQTAFQVGLLATCLLIFLSAALGWPVAASIRRRRAERLAAATLLARWAGWAMSMAFLGFVVGFALEVWNNGILYYGLTPAARVILILPLLGAALAAVTLVLTAAAWMGSGASSRRPYWSLPGRVHYTLLAVAGVAFSWWLNHWNLLHAPI